MIGAVDIGGTKTLVAVFDKHGKLTEKVKFLTPENYEDFKIELAKVVANMSTSDFSKVVVAAPGLINRKKGMVLAFGNLPWQNVHLEADCEKIFMAPVIIENDAKLAGLFEALLLKNKYRKILYVTISTGIGSGYIIDGHIDPDFDDAEVGHMLLEHQDRLVAWEDFASGKAIVSKFGKEVSEITDPLALYSIARNIAVGLITLVATLTPEAIVIGGGVGAHLDKFKDRLDEQLLNYESPMLKMPVILKAKRSEEAVIYGCYEFAKQHHENKSTK